MRAFGALTEPTRRAQEEDLGMGRSAAGRHFAGLSGWYRGLPRSRTRLLKAVLFAVSLLILVWPRFDAALDSAERYRGIQTQDEWDATAVWLGVAACARQTGSWLMMCEAPGKLVPMSADDPGHAFLLGLWSQLAGRDATFLDVARLNLGVNAVGLVMLAGALAILGAFTGSIVVLALGPVVYFSWFGVSPHWAVILHGDKLLALNLVMLGFIGLFVGQAVLAHLSRLYAAPTGTFMVAMMGIAVENLRRWAWRCWSTTLGVGNGGPHSP
ncbi:MAG: hypothetical protein KIT25_09785 [Enhydrobacter sp.]|nr:MAG: hypothetical protein KIT25_09785 [Enhydrobacter sp.]